MKRGLFISYGSALQPWIFGGWETIFPKSSLKGMVCLRIAEELFKRYGQEKLILFVGLARQIWFRRIVVIHGDTFKHPNELVRKLH
jgi:hypothetical protein